MNEFFVQFSKDCVEFAPKLTLGVVIALVFYVLGVIVQKMLRRVANRIPSGKGRVFRLIGSTGRILIWLTGAITALGTMGVNVSALVASLGLTGFALGFALKDALSNVLAGALILVYQPFQCGDRIRVAGCEGTILEINLRYTILKGPDHTHLIPNATLYTNTVDIAEKEQ